MKADFIYRVIPLTIVLQSNSVRSSGISFWNSYKKNLQNFSEGSNLLHPKYTGFLFNQRFVQGLGSSRAASGLAKNSPLPFTLHKNAHIHVFNKNLMQPSKAAYTSGAQSEGTEIQEKDTSSMDLPGLRKELARQVVSDFFIRGANIVAIEKFDSPRSHANSKNL